MISILVWRKFFFPERQVCSSTVSTKLLSHACTPSGYRAAAQQQENGAAVDGSAEVIVKIDNESDAFATVVTVEFGDKLGELLDTVSWAMRI